MATILIVDDSKTVRDMLGSLVTSSGHQPIFAENGDQGYAMAVQLKPALVFMDVVMPGTNGFNACRKIKGDPATAKIPVVLVTTKAGESDKFWGKKQGADDYVVKPFEPDQIKNILRTVR